jgi:hypothetical protein
VPARPLSPSSRIGAGGADGPAPSEGGGGGSPAPAGAGGIPVPGAAAGESPNDRLLSVLGADSREFGGGGRCIDVGVVFIPGLAPGPMFVGPMPSPAGAPAVPDVLPSSRRGKGRPEGSVGRSELLVTGLAGGTAPAAGAAPGAGMVLKPLTVELSFVLPGMVVLVSVAAPGRPVRLPVAGGVPGVSVGAVPSFTTASA